MYITMNFIVVFILCFMSGKSSLMFLSLSDTISDLLGKTSSVICVIVSIRVSYSCFVYKHFQRYLCVYFNE